LASLAPVVFLSCAATYTSKSLLAHLNTVIFALAVMPVTKAGFVMLTLNIAAAHTKLKACVLG
jgi:hypothetical protein